MSNEQGRRIDDKRSQEAVDWSEVREVLSYHPMPAQAAATEQATIDTPEFQELLDEFAYRASERRAMGGDFGSAEAEEKAESALVAYINSVKLTPLATPADAGAGQPNECTVPPEGWDCTRTAGHEGPCAAVPVNEDGYTEKEEAIYQRGLEDGKAVARGMERYRQGIARLSTPAAPVTAAELPAPDGWIATAVIGSELTSVAFRTEATAHKSCVTGAPFPFWKSAPAPVTADAGAAAPVSRDAVLEEAALIALEHSYGPCGEHDYSYDDASAKADARADDIAAAIRYRKSQPVAAAAGEDARDAALKAAREWIVNARPALTIARQATVDAYLGVLAKIDAAMSPPSPVGSAKQGGSDA